MRGIATVPSYVIMQPTTLCNLDCRYCYLPLRAHDRRMPVEVAGAVAASVNEWAQAVPRFSVVWHGGEPLAAGRDHLAALMAAFHGVEHHIQTNATLVDDEWCAFLAERGVKVGLSIDGPEDLTAQRVNRGGRRHTRRSCAALRRCAGTVSRSPHCVSSPTRGRAWPRGCTGSSWSSAATRWASTWRSGKASTGATPGTAATWYAPSGRS